MQLLWAWPALAQPAPQASLDRSQIALGESVVLTIHIATSDAPADPDFSVLAEDFEVLGPRRSTRHIIRNGRSESSTEWQVTLLPRHAGSVTIPPIAVGATATQPLQLQVEPARQLAKQAGQPVFIETEIDHEAVYVKQQLLFTVRVYHAVPLDDMSLSEPAFDDATVHKVAQDSFTREVDGTLYRVHELRYAIFANHAGTLTVPELVFSASQPLQQRSLFDFPGRGRALRRLTPQAQVTVKPVPNAFTGPVWLPATNLTLVESWSTSPHQLAVGDSVTRTLTLRADGLPAAQLPELPQADLATARLYPDQPQLDNQSNAQGVVGTRTESTALIATAPGDIVLPGTEVIWWDTATDTQRKAAVPEQRFTVTGAASAPNAAIPNPASSATSTPAPTSAPTSANTDAAALSSIPTATTALPRRVWQVAVAGLAVAWLVTLGLYLRLRRKAAPTAAPGVSVTDSEAERFDQLIRACRQGHPEPARRALLAWARTFYAAPALRSTQRLQSHLAGAEARAAVATLDQALFGSDGDETASAGRGGSGWNGKALAKAIAAERKARGAAEPGLQPLYPDA